MGLVLDFFFSSTNQCWIEDPLGINRINDVKSMGLRSRFLGHPCKFSHHPSPNSLNMNIYNGKCIFQHALHSGGTYFRQNVCENNGTCISS